MRLPRPVPPAAARPLVLAAVLGGLLAGCTSGGDDVPARFRPPPAAALAAGPCALVADDVVALGRATYDLRGTAEPDQAARDALELSQQRVSAVAETADPTTRAALTALVTRTGAVRIQAATGRLEDDVLTLMRESYEGAVDACTAAGSATPTATTG